MASIRSRPDTGTLFFDLRWEGKRYRAQTDLPDTPENREQLAPQLRLINDALKRGTFKLGEFFPELNSPTQTTASVVTVAPSPAPPAPLETVVTPPFATFSEQWFTEFKVGWRRSYITTVRGILDKHLLPRFGATPVKSITRAQILELRTHLAGLRGRREGTKMSNARINTVMLILRQILQEAGDRFEFTVPMARIKPLKLRKPEVFPFTLEETQLIINKVRVDYRNYMKTRFFTAMRSGELNGLKWKYVDFEQRLILVRETIVCGEEDYTKNDFSQRDIAMSQVVYDALKEQHKATGHMEYVFCNKAGEPVDIANFTKRVWYPLLRHLGLKLRRPYQTRHTAATLWLAAGEAPTWIAQTMGHNSVETLFRVYSRYVKNQTRRDGSAIDRLLTATFGSSSEDPPPEAQPPPVSWRLAA